MRSARCASTLKRRALPLRRVREVARAGPGNDTAQCSEQAAAQGSQGGSHHLATVGAPTESSAEEVIVAAV